jgi:hypothetical protein
MTREEHVNHPCRLRAAVVAALGAFALASCATVDVGGTAGPPVQAPEYRVGDRWVYHAVQGYLAKIEWNETHEVIAVGPGGITVKVSVKGPTIDVERIEKWSAPGVVLQGAVFEPETDRIEPPLVRYQFPLTTGETWNQRVRDLDAEPGPYNTISRYVTVGGHQTITTPAGTFDAIGMRVLMQLDDETFWRYATQCNYLVWYSPAVGAVVHEHKESQWRDKGGQDAVGYHPGQYTDIDLVSYTRGR